LPYAFNNHWRAALNYQLAGKNIRYFAMLHDDIVPEDFWLDTLLDELELTGADLISAVVPLKDGRGLTSTAIDDPNDPWDVYRRLHMNEVVTLPETFSAKDCWKTEGDKGRALLANTGCWVCRFDRLWRWQVHFQINTAMVFIVGEDWSGRYGDGEPEVFYKEGTIISNRKYRPGMVGCFTSKVMSEDWDFSRQLTALGGDVRCTRKVKLQHVGDYPFPNTESWGQHENDQALRHKWDVTWKDIPHGVEGWLLEEEGRELARLAEGKNVLEIGSYCGLSTIWMARKAELVYCVDTFTNTDPTGQTKPRDTLDIFKKNLKKYEISNVLYFKGSTTASLPTLKRFGPRFDMVFVDGAHDVQSVRYDIIAALEVINPGGLILFHDYLTDIAEHKGVAVAVDELLSAGAVLVRQFGTIAVVDPAQVIDNMANANNLERYGELNNGGKEKRTTAEAKEKVESI